MAVYAHKATLSSNENALTAATHKYSAEGNNPERRKYPFKMQFSSRKNRQRNPWCAKCGEWLPGWRKGHDRKEARGELPWVATLCYILKDLLSCTLTLRAPFRLDSHFCSKLRSKCVVNGKVTSLHCMVRKKKRKEKKKGLRPLHYPIVPPVMSF